MKKGIIIGSIVLAVAALGTGAYFMFGKKGDADSTSSSSDDQNKIKDADTKADNGSETPKSKKDGANPKPPTGGVVPIPYGATNQYEVVNKVKEEEKVYIAPPDIPKLSVDGRIVEPYISLVDNKKRYIRVGAVPLNTNINANQESFY